MLTGPKSVVSRSVRPSLVLNTPVRTAEVCCEPGSEGCGCSMAAGSLASAAKAGGVSRTPENKSASSGTSAARRAMEKSFCSKRMFIVERNFLPSDRLLNFARANLPQGSGAAQPHIAAGIAVLQLLQHAYYAFQRLVFFGTPWLYRRSGSGRLRRKLIGAATVQRTNEHVHGFHAHARIDVMLQGIEQ